MMKINLKLGPPFVIIVFLFGCKPENSETDRSGFEKKPYCSIVYLDGYYSNYLRSVNQNFSKRDKIYTDSIKDAIINKHFINSIYADLLIENFSNPVADTTGLIKFITDLKSNQTKVDNIIKSTFILCNNQLKNDNVIFYLVPSCSSMHESIMKMGGVIGQTAGNKQILLTIDFNISGWKELLAYTVAHEFNHAYWTNEHLSANFKFTLLENLVFEGKADSFAHLVCPKVKVPWTCSLSEGEITNLWTKIKPNMHSENPQLLAEVMFGSENYPNWGGYTLGYNILQSAFINHPEILNSNWTNLDAEKLLNESDYH